MRVGTTWSVYSFSRTIQSEFHGIESVQHGLYIHSVVLSSLDFTVQSRYNMVCIFILSYYPVWIPRYRVGTTWSEYSFSRTIQSGFHGIESTQKVICNRCSLTRLQCITTTLQNIKIKYFVTCIFSIFNYANDIHRLITIQIELSSFQDLIRSLLL